MKNDIHGKNLSNSTNESISFKFSITIQMGDFGLLTETSVTISSLLDRTKR